MRRLFLLTAVALLTLAAREDMAPPVALLTYVPDEPARAAFYPFARFSPEWCAIRHALGSDVVLSSGRELRLNAVSTPSCRPSPRSEARRSSS